MGQTVSPRACDPHSDESLDSLIRLASDSADWVEKDARYLVDKVDQLLEAATWPKRVAGEPKSWERFCSEVLGYDADYIQKIREGLEVLEENGVTDATVDQCVETAEAIRSHGGDRRSEKFQTDNISLKTGFGTSAEYTLRRLRRDRPELAEKVAAGEISAHAAAQEAGFRKPMVNIPLEPDRAAKLIFKHFQGANLEPLLRELTRLAGLDVAEASWANLPQP